MGICPHHGHILCTLGLAPSPLLLWAPAVIFEGSEPLKTKAGFLNEHFQHSTRRLPVTKAQTQWVLSLL